ncbi:hypothetical protein [uncultured Prevotella sp.]|uniref:hypothetical protein n=1 Tax=uncultured Prevotella sp. TaxID=159272 RepID=UPI00338E2ABF
MQTVQSDALSISQHIDIHLIAITCYRFYLLLRQSYLKQFCTTALHALQLWFCRRQIVKRQVRGSASCMLEYPYFQ